MEENNKRHIAIIGYCGTGKESLTKALGEKLETVNIDELDEFEFAGFHLTKEQKQTLMDIGITVQELKDITTEYDLLDKIAEKWNEINDKNDNKSEPLKRKTKTWNKKKFYEK